MPFQSTCPEHPLTQAFPSMRRSLWMPSKVLLSQLSWPNQWAASSAVMACARAPVGRLILVNAMVPVPGETPGEWWTTTGAIDARIAAAEAGGYDTEFELATYFLHDLGTEDAAAVLANPGDEADLAFGQRCDVESWPHVPTAAVIGRDDRLFPCEFQRQLVHDRVGIDDPTIIPGGHLLALANPDGLFEALVDLTGT